LHQLGDRGDAVVGGLHGLHRVRHGVEQVAEVAGARVERGGREIGDRIVERRVDLQAGGETLLRLLNQARGVLQREEVRPNAGRKDDVGHFRDLSGLQIVVPIASDRVRQIRGPAVIKAEYVWLTAVKVNGTSTPRRCPGYAASFTCAGASNWVATSP